MDCCTIQMVNHLPECLSSMTVRTAREGDRCEEQQDMNLSFPEEILLPDVALCSGGPAQTDAGAIPRLTLKPRTTVVSQTHEVGCWERKPAPPLFPTLERQPTEKSDLPTARILPLPRHLVLGDGLVKKSSSLSCDSDVYCFATPHNTERKHLPTVGPNLWIPPMA